MNVWAHAASDWSVGNRVWVMGDGDGDGDGSAVSGWTGGGWGYREQGEGWRRIAVHKRCVTGTSNTSVLHLPGEVQQQAPSQVGNKVTPA